MIVFRERNLIKSKVTIRVHILMQTNFLTEANKSKNYVFCFALIFPSPLKVPITVEKYEQCAKWLSSLLGLNDQIFQGKV